MMDKQQEAVYKRGYLDGYDGASNASDGYDEWYDDYNKGYNDGQRVRATMECDEYTNDYWFNER
jgi:hypothetical protein